LPVLVLPDHHELRAAFAVAGRDLAEAVLAFLDRAEILDRVHLERPRNPFAADLVANVLPRVGYHRVAIEGGPATVVIELDSRRKVAGEGIQVAAVVSVEDLIIQRGDGAREGGCVHGFLASVR